MPLRCLTLPHLSFCRDQDQAPLCLVALVRQAPDPQGSASRVSISGTCSSVWRTRDLPVAPISSTRAFSNRLDVKDNEEEERGERGWGGGDEVFGETTAPITGRVQETLINEEEEGSDLAHFKVFQLYSNVKYSCSHIGWPLYLSPQIMPIFFQSSRGLQSLYLPCTTCFLRKCKKCINVFWGRVFVRTNDLKYALSHSTVYFLIRCVCVRLWSNGNQNFCFHRPPIIILNNDFFVCFVNWIRLNSRLCNLLSCLPNYE